MWQLNDTMVLRTPSGRQMENIIYTFDFLDPWDFVTADDADGYVTIAPHSNPGEPWGRASVAMRRFVATWSRGQLAHVLVSAYASRHVRVARSGPRRIAWPRRHVATSPD